MNVKKKKLKKRFVESSVFLGVLQGKRERELDFESEVERTLYNLTAWLFFFQLCEYKKNVQFNMLSLFDLARKVGGR